jgi:hypothetical protein
MAGSKILRLLGLSTKRKAERRRFSDLQDLSSLMAFFHRVADMPGCVAECGLGQGITFAMLSLLIREEGKQRPLWGFDSFQGFPEPTIEDKSPRNPRRGEWNATTKGEMLNCLSQFGDTSHIQIIEGFFEKTLPISPVRDISLLHLDVDLYASYKICLEELFPRMVPGGIVVFDEFAREKWPGARRAIDQYFEGTPYVPQVESSNPRKYYVVKKSTA